jgi:hypothetical protein
MHVSRLLTRALAHLKSRLLEGADGDRLTSPSYSPRRPAAARRPGLRVRPRGGAGKPKYGQLALCYDPDEKAARARARELWRWAMPGWHVMTELPTSAAPLQFARLSGELRGRIGSRHSRRPASHISP